jgi:hypothetical protein
LKGHAFLLFLALVPALAVASSKKPTPAPLPSQITQAKTVFLANGGGSDLAYDAFYQGIKSWGKYQIVGSPDNADIIIELRYWVDYHGSSSHTYYNPETNQANTSTSADKDPKMGVTIYDPKSKISLWQTVHDRKLVFRWNYDKEMVKTANALVDELKARSQ